ncbi:MAG: type IV pilus modification protein PilV [Candidatus Thiodiazotropha sp.]
MRTEIKVPRFRYARGMTLIEVLIAAIVIAVGLLGVAAMQVTALQGSSNANFRARSVDLASTLTDRIRANLTALNTYATTDPTGCDNPPNPICAMVPDGSAAAASDCTPDQMAVYDVWDVSCKVENEYPPGSTLTITCPGGCPALQQMTIDISWPTPELVNDVPVMQTVSTQIIPGAPISTPGGGA